MTINREAVIEKLKDLKSQGFEVPSEDMIKTNDEIQKIREASKINTELLDLIAENIKSGMTTEEIDNIANEFVISKGAESTLIDYPNGPRTHKFPKSISLSINDEIYFGIPSSNVVLKDGDIVNIDTHIRYQGYCSDASRMFMIGNVSNEAKRLVEVANECLHKGIEKVKPWGHIGDIIDAVEKHAEGNGYSVFNLMGHGVGRNVPEEPIFGPNGIGGMGVVLGNTPTLGTNKVGKGMILAPGMVISIEPAINEGERDWNVDRDNGFTIYTNDKKLSAQWEHTMLVTENGVEILCK